VSILGLLALVQLFAKRVDSPEGRTHNSREQHDGRFAPMGQGRGRVVLGLRARTTVDPAEASVRERSATMSHTLWVLAAGLMALTLSGLAWGADCDACPECSADPAFVQRDQRAPGFALLLRRFGSRELRREGLKMMVVVHDEEECCEEGERAARERLTLVLIGEQGRKESHELCGAERELVPLRRK
jgi:hypothetical protein